MKFGPVSIEQAEGGLLAHAVRTDARLLRKGHVLSANDIASLQENGIRSVVIARLDTDDVAENEAAARIGRKLAGNDIRIAAAFTGRVNLHAAADGLVQLDADCIRALNTVDEAITVATLSPFSRVSAGQIVATVKIIPFAAPSHAVDQAEQLVSHAAIGVAPFQRRKVALILTRPEEDRPALRQKTRHAIAHRVTSVGSQVVIECEVAHSVEELAPALKRAAAETDLILVFGASAISDREDVIPAALQEAGGTTERFGMPVDPGNLLLLGKLHGADVIGLPGCARSPKLNGFDFVLWRLATGLQITAEDIAAMGVGGLLMEIPVRPQPRDEQTASTPYNVGAVVLAAVASSRMGGNKLLSDFTGTALVRRVAESALASTAHPVVVVLGNETERVRAALSGLDLICVDNPDFSAGLSTSLKRGLKALPADRDAAVVLLGDMPEVAPPLIDRLVDAFDPARGRAICLATHNGKRGNPVLFARRFFEEIEAIEGDVGARGLIGEYPELVCEVEAGSDAPLIDIDTPQDLAAYRKGRP